MTNDLNIEQLTKKLDAQYRNPANDSVRVADDILIKHAIETPDFKMTSMRVSNINPQVEEYSYVLSVYENIRGVIRRFHDNTDTARAVFNRLEQTAHETDKMRPLTTPEKDAIINALGRMTFRTRYAQIKDGINFLDTYTVHHRNGIKIHGVIEQYRGGDAPYYYVSIRNPWPMTSPLPRQYNSQNSNDESFAIRVIMELKKYVR